MTFGGITPTYTPKYTAIIQARMGSSRLPGKVMMDINGKTLLERVYENASKAVETVIATTPDSKEIISFCEKREIPYFIGSESDVLDRYYQCAVKYGIKNIIRLTADNPLIPPELITKLIEHHKTYYELDYVSNCRIKTTYPIGMDAELFTFNALGKAWKQAKSAYEREHVTPYIYNHPELFKLWVIKNDIDMSFLRVTVDTKEDLENVRWIMSNR